jgi:hypothetical protein
MQPLTPLTPLPYILVSEPTGYSIIYITRKTRSHLRPQARTRIKAPDVMHKMYVLLIATTIPCKTCRCTSLLRDCRKVEPAPEMADLISDEEAPGRTAAICRCASLRKMVFASVKAITRPPICARLMNATAGFCQWALSPSNLSRHSIPEAISDRGTTA